MNSGFSPSEKKYMLSLARASIELYVKFGKALRLDMEDAPKSLLEEAACFVSLHEGAELKGCIGSLQAFRPLVLDISANAIASATQDPRFPPLLESELGKITVSISVLSKPRPLLVRSGEDLLSKLKKGRDGLIIKKGFFSATFLPVVWDDLSEKEEFLTHLCRKAGLSADEWRDPEGMEFFTYGAEEFSESEVKKWFWGRLLHAGK